MTAEQESLAQQIAELRVQVASLWKQTFGTLPPSLHSTKPSTTCVFVQPPSAATTTSDRSQALIKSASVFDSSKPPSQPKIKNHGVFSLGIKNPEPALDREIPVVETLDLSSIKMEKKEIEDENQVVVIKVHKRTHAPTATYAQEVLAKIPMKTETLYGFAETLYGFDHGIETKKQAKVETTVTPRLNLFGKFPYLELFDKNSEVYIVTTGKNSIKYVDEALRYGRRFIREKIKGPMLQEAYKVTSALHVFDEMPEPKPRPCESIEYVFDPGIQTNLPKP